MILPAADVAPHDPTALPLAVVVEDAAEMAGLPAHEEALFHLINHMAAAGGHLLLTAQTPPRDWGLTLPDLLSRLQATAIARLDPPDDALLSAVLVKLFADRQIAVPANLIPYLTARMDRSIAAARHLVATLDARALALGRPITRALAAELLDSADQG
jgi:chromosomal replication initiation ATPase DnaA